MSRSKLRLPDYLEHMLGALRRIDTYTAGMSADEFSTSTIVQDAVSRNIEVIGEASRNIQLHHPEHATSISELPLAAAYRMRNALAHGYFQVDTGIVWTTVKTILPGLQRQIEAALAGLPESDGRDID